jgi:hypothetical protein
MPVYVSHLNTLRGCPALGTTAGECGGEDLVPFFGWNSGLSNNCMTLDKLPNLLVFQSPGH